MYELPEKNKIAVTSNWRQELDEKTREFVVGGTRDYSTLPDIFTFEDGTKVKSVDDWRKRRNEILTFFSKEVYGVLPKEGFETTFEILEEALVFEGNATRRQIKITVETQKGKSDAMMLMYIPKKTPCPTIVGLNFKGNRSVIDDVAVIDSMEKEIYGWQGEVITDVERGVDANAWCIEDGVKNGYAVATILADDFAKDSAEKYRSRVIDLFDEEDFKTISAWSFGLLRAVDYMYETDEIDNDKIALIGHSRLGKAALWAAANDERVGCVYANDSGHAGASLARDSRGENIGAINDNFPHWMGNNYQKYTDNEDKLPVDQHMLLALIAPRKLYLADAKNDLWADPQGAWNSLMYAQKVYELYGLETIPYSDSLPEIGEQLMTQNVGYHIRDGWHELTPEDIELWGRGL